MMEMVDDKSQRFDLFLHDFYKSTWDFKNNFFIFTKELLESTNLEPTPIIK